MKVVMIVFAHNFPQTRCYTLSLLYNMDILRCGLNEPVLIVANLKEKNPNRRYLSYRSNEILFRDLN